MPLQILRQDITKMKVDAIVNTTNEKMLSFSGVDLAIHKAAGPELKGFCEKLPPLGKGNAVITPGFELMAKHIIHTSGPTWQGGLKGESIILKSCYVRSMETALENGLESVAFPLISSGAYGYPKDKVLRFAIQVITEFLRDHELSVYLCVYDRTSYNFSRELYDDITDFLQQNTKEASRCPKAPSPSVRRRSFALSEKEDFIGRAPKGGGVPEEICSSVIRNQTLDEYMQSMDKPFAFKLFDLIDKSGMTDVECYKKANVDKKTFSKIKCNPQTYRPSKQTAVAFAVALELNLDETQDLLASAGLTLSRSFVFDKIIRYFIQKKIYDIHLINEALFEFDQVLLGV